MQYKLQVEVTIEFLFEKKNVKVNFQVLFK